ncbi:uncharacterized protein LOC114519896 [Dendronephthya gigantea]|uniref:uncharacterized protein LOC114519896 n=1 Tax=Dendronephthya gigantea TaxID=151771 RepID=UPI00106D3BB7|nr:uncharacterized protein LOC114519896 [Dendronephthya gigantea]
MEKQVYIAEIGKTKEILRASKRIMRLVMVGHQLLMVNIYLQDETGQRSSANAEPGNNSEKSYEWFKEDKLLAIVDSLKQVMVKRINSFAKQYYSKKLESARDLTVRYSFKRRSSTPGQHYVTTKPESIFCLHGRKIKEKNVSYKSCPIFHETLEVEVRRIPATTKSENDQVNIVQRQIKPVKENIQIQEAATSSYFNEQTDILQTSSVKRKKTTLRKMAKKSRVALTEIPSYQKNSKSQASPVSHKGQIIVVENNSFLEKNNSPLTESVLGGAANRAKITAVIDLEQVPAGLNHVSKVEDLQEDHLKFLINQMEDYLRTIFRGEVYSQRHEDYKKGGKYRDDLNFQVGMAHFNEDQHECIMSSLVAMFCYRDSKYLDYVTKVMLPEALIKLYQDIHKTSFEEAEECLFNDTICDN